MTKLTIADAAQKVFQKQTVKTIGGDYVSVELVKQVIGVLGSLRASSFRGDEQGKLAHYILGDIMKPGDKNQVMQDVVEQYGAFLEPVVDAQTREIKSDAQKIIHDVLKFADDNVKIGPEYQLTVQHYIDQLDALEGGAHHYVLDKGTELRRMDGPAKPLVAPSPEATASKGLRSASEIWGAVRAEQMGKKIERVSALPEGEAGPKKMDLVAEAISKGTGSAANMALVARMANTLS